MTAIMSHAKFCGDHLITVWYLNVDHMTEKNKQSYVHFYGINCRHTKLEQMPVSLITFYYLFKFNEKFVIF